MRESFEEALQVLLAKYADADQSEILSALELAAMTIRENQEEEG